MEPRSVTKVLCAALRQPIILDIMVPRSLRIQLFHAPPPGLTDGSPVPIEPSFGVSDSDATHDPGHTQGRDFHGAPCTRAPPTTGRTTPEPKKSSQRSQWDLRGRCLAASWCQVAWKAPQAAANLALVPGSPPVLTLSTQHLCVLFGCTIDNDGFRSVHASQDRRSPFDLKLGSVEQDGVCPHHAVEVPSACNPVQRRCRGGRPRLWPTAVLGIVTPHPLRDHPPTISPNMWSK